jgi:hypothetical protein
MTPTERGERARAFFDDPIMKLAFADFRGYLISKIEGIDSGDHEAQHELVLQLQILKSLRAKLAQYESELTLNAAEEKQKSFIERTRKRFTP